VLKFSALYTADFSLEEAHLGSVYNASTTL
jgi:hypothetical protein